MDCEVGNLGHLHTSPRVLISISSYEQMGLGGSRLCVQPCEGDHPIKAVSQIKLKYLLGGLGPRESRGVAQAGRQEAQTAEPCGPRWVWDKGTRLLPCEGDPTGFQNSQGFETGLEGQLGCFDRQR